MLGRKVRPLRLSKQTNKMKAYTYTDDLDDQGCSERLELTPGLQLDVGITPAGQRVKLYAGNHVFSLNKKEAKELAHRVLERANAK